MGRVHTRARNLAPRACMIERNTPCFVGLEGVWCMVCVCACGVERLVSSGLVTLRGVTLDRRCEREESAEGES